jgi:hypothetical protein
MLEPELSAKSTEASGVRVPPPLHYVQACAYEHDPDAAE